MALKISLGVLVPETRTGAGSEQGTLFVLFVKTFKIKLKSVLVECAIHLMVSGIVCDPPDGS